MSGLYASGYLSSDITLRQYDDTGSQTGSAGMYDDTYVYLGLAVSQTESGTIYAATHGPYVTKFSSAMSAAWTRQMHSSSGSIESVAVDASDNVYTGGTLAGSNTTRKYDSSGTLQWQKSHGDTVYSIAVDSSGNVYTGGVRTSSLTTRKYNSSGTLQWSKDHGADVYGVVVDASGNVYTAGVRTGSVTTRKYNSSGTEQWGRDYHGADLLSIDLGASDDIYVGGASDGTYTTRKYNSSGTLQWSANHGDTVTCVRFFATSPTTDVPALALALALGIPSTEMAHDVPALAVSVSLGIPSPAMAHDVPALAVSLALGIPAGTEPLSPPDLSSLVYPLPVIYRGWVSGSDMLQVSLLSIQCRRRRGESTWIDVEIPYSSALALSLPSKMGSDLLVYAGTRAADGAETLGVFLRGTLTEYRYERDPWNAMIRLTARAQTPSYTATDRTLFGVTGRGKDDAGRRVARGAVDSLLRPGDTVHDGISSWIAGAISYRIAPNEAFMDVTED